MRKTNHIKEKDQGKQMQKKSRDDAANRSHASSLRGFAAIKQKQPAMEKKNEEAENTKVLRMRSMWAEISIPYCLPSHEIN